MIRWDSVVVGCLLCFLVVAELPEDDDRKTHYDEHGALVVPMSDEHVIDLYTRWIEQSLSAVVSVIATKKLKEVPEPLRQEFALCSKRAQNVHKHAKCLDHLWAKRGNQFETFGEKRRRELNVLKSRLQRYSNPNNHQWIGPFRTRQRRWINVKPVSSYALRDSHHEGSSPLGYVARGLLKAVLVTKNRTRTTRWQEVVERAQKIQQVTDNVDSGQKLLNRHSGRLQMFHSHSRNKIANDEPIEQNENDLNFMSLKEKDSYGNGDYMNRIFNFNQDFGAKNEATAQENMSRRLINLVQDGVKLGYSLAGANQTDLEKKDSMRLVSPRFLSVMPERSDPENKTLDFMSPSLFSLHSNGQGIENLTSLPNLFREFTGEDQQAWLDLIVESSGVSDHLQKLEQRFQATELSPNAKILKESLQRYKDEAYTKDGQPLYFTKENVTRIYGKFGERRIDHWMALQKTLTRDQLNQLNTTGLSTMSPDQLQMVYGPTSPFNDTKSLQRLQRVMWNSSPEQIERLIREDMKKLSQADQIKIRRKRDVVLSPITFTVLSGLSINEPAILSPLFFAPLINQFTILG